MRLGHQLRLLRADIRRGGGAVFTVDIGDVLDRVRPETDVTSGFVNAAMMSALGYDAWVFGNNEGLTVPVAAWSRLIQRAGATTLVANFRQVGGHAFDDLHDTCVWDVEGVLVGVFGVTPDYRVPYDMLGVAALDPFATATQAVARLREQGCRVVIALSHLGLRDDRRLAADVPGIDLILGGHTHQFMLEAEWVGYTAIFQPGKHALTFGHTWLEYDQTRQRVTRVQSEPIPVDLHGPYDQAMLSAFLEDLPAIEDQLTQHVTHLEAPLVTEFVRESPFANALVDALFEAFPTDIGIMMAGALNASLLPGDVQWQHVLGACSTPTRPLQMTLRGADLRALLAKAVHPDYYARPGFGYGFRGSLVGYLALANATAVVEQAASGSPTLKELIISGRPVEDARDYRVTTCEYLWLSPVFEEFQRGRDIAIQAPLVREVLLQRMKSPGFIERTHHLRYTTL